MRKVYILPNLFTAGNLFCGLMAAFEALSFNSESGGDIVFACQLIFLAGIFDVFDGLVARITRAQSAFGLNFDSLADVISFGAAPAMIVYANVSQSYPRLATATCGLFVICAALRLARFNVQAAKQEKRAFLGLPTPGAGCFVASLMWVFVEWSSPIAALPPEKLLPPIMVTLAYLMVSKVQYLGLKSIRLSSRQPFEILVSVVVAISLVVMLKQHLDLVLFGCFGFYALSGPALILRGRLRRAHIAAIPPQARHEDTHGAAPRGPLSS